MTTFKVDVKDISSKSIGNSLGTVSCTTDQPHCSFTAVLYSYSQRF